MWKLVSIKRASTGLASFRHCQLTETASDRGRCLLCVATFRRFIFCLAATVICTVGAALFWFFQRFAIPNATWVVHSCSIRHSKPFKKPRTRQFWQRKKSVSGWILTSRQMHLPKRKTAWFKANMTMDNIVCFSRKRQQFVEKRFIGLETYLSFVPQHKISQAFWHQRKNQ